MLLKIINTFIHSFIQIPTQRHSQPNPCKGEQFAAEHPCLKGLECVHVTVCIVTVIVIFDDTGDISTVHKDIDSVNEKVILMMKRTSVLMPIIALVITVEPLTPQKNMVRFLSNSSKFKCNVM